MLITVIDRIQGGSVLTKVNLDQVQSLSYPCGEKDTYSIQLQGQFFNILLDKKDGERVDKALEQLHSL